MDIKVFLDKNKDKLDARERALIMTEINKGTTVSWLSQEHEPAFYAWYAIGRTTKDISELTKVPEPILLLTMLRYNWKERAEADKEAGNAPLSQLAQETYSSIFALTRIALQKELHEVMTGQKDPRQSKFIPQNASQLMDLLDRLREPTEGTTVNNTQINLNVNATGATPQAAAVTQPAPQLSRLEKLKLMAGEKIIEESIDAQVVKG
jgi:hypothetical protein